MPDTSEFLRDKVIVVTGGAGSIGSEIVKQLLEYPVKAIRVLDNNEHTLFMLKRRLTDTRVRFLLGDIRNRERCYLLVRGADIIVHCAAYKNIEISEYNMPEVIETNINGYLNIVEACVGRAPELLCNVSSDKAVNPTTLYGATKLAAEKLTNWAHGIVGSLRAYTVRLGNVFESNGNVFEVWNEELAKGEPLTITDPQMERYYMHCQDAAKFIINTLSLAKGGEIFMPKMERYKMIDLAKDILQKTFEQGWLPSEEFVWSKLKTVGIRAGEKLVEELMTEEEKKRAIETNSCYII